MAQQQLLYNFSSIVITATLFVLIILFNEIGFHIGRFIQHRTDTEIKTLTGAIQASILGLLALLLSFTFSMSMQRYDNRSQALISEANSIQTAMLRVQLLPEQYKNKAIHMLHRYVDLRIAISQIDMTRREERKEYNRQIYEVQNDLWSLAVMAAKEDPRPVTSGAFIISLNEVIDIQGKRNALLQMHVPEVVLFLLFMVFIASGGILGYSSGLSGKRVVAPTIMVSFLIAMIVFIIIDLDRPKRGVIQVDQTSILELQMNNHK
ncbi:MAG: hypothetical protein MRK01_06915 [Candidatus Scalindua sp.]|nr:hypothetical protein [Candidatus Scalindua sp.]